MEDKRLAKEKLIMPNEVFFQEVESFLNKGHDVLIKVQGRSMMPFLSHGDKVLITKMSGRGVWKIGRIVLGKSNVGYVLHRLVWHNKKYIWLAGDNNLVQLEKLAKTDVLGYAKYAETKNGRVAVDSLWSTFGGVIWFLLRPLRWIKYKISKFIEK